MRTSTLAVSLAALLLVSTPAMAKSKEKLDSSKYYDLKESEVVANSDDPWEGFNRPIFDFNLFFDRNVFKPFLSAYDLIPQTGRTGIGNFLTNLGEPLNAIHGVLQLNPKITFTSMWRFLLNTSFGMGGVNDFARDYASLPNMEQSLGGTFGAWGVPTGPYLVLPIMGPTNLRGGVGMAGNWALDPLTYALKPWEMVAERAAEGIDYRDSQNAIIEHLYYDSLDPYIATRSAFLQNQAFTAAKQKNVAPAE
ncbi:MAG: VacJ family lipoprotein [Rickettsiales bacterium]|nr:VacJ family lipoprotein [Rickettsiales bacterium]